MVLILAERLLEYCAMDVVLVAIDFENPDGICGKPYMREGGRIYSNEEGLHNTQTGIAILDTRDLNKSNPESSVTNLQFHTGHEIYDDIVSKRLIFGAPAQYAKSPQDVRPILTNTLRFTSVEGTLRPLVIIGFSLNPNSDRSDVACLVKLTDPRRCSPIIDYLDVYNTRILKQPTLQRLLDHLAVPYANLHVAINDANATLRAALIITVREHQNIKDLTNAEVEILSKLEAIALAPIIVPPGIRRVCAFGTKTRQIARRRIQAQIDAKNKADRKSVKRPKDYDYWQDLADNPLPWDVENEENLNLE